MIQVLHRADTVLRLISAQDRVSFYDLWRETDLHKSTLANILRSLCEVGYVRRCEKAHYALGEGLAELARPLLARRDLTELARRHVERLCRGIEENTVCAVLRQGVGHVIARAVASRTVIVNTEDTPHRAFYASATARVLLAFAHPSVRDEALRIQGLPSAADWPEAAESQALLSVLQRIRRQAYAENLTRDGEVVFLAVPVFDDRKSIVAALGAAVPRNRINADQKIAMLSAMRREADDFRDGFTVLGHGNATESDERKETSKCQ